MFFERYGCLKGVFKMFFERYGCLKDVFKMFFERYGCLKDVFKTSVFYWEVTESSYRIDIN